MLKNFSTIEEMEAYISTQIHGAFSTMDMQVLAKYVQKLQSGDKYLEIGTDFGKSAATAIFQSSEGVKFYFCDINDPSAPPSTLLNLLSRKDFFEQEKLDTVGEFFLKESKELAKIWDKGELSMIFIDGNHSYEAVKDDILGWFPHLKINGWMLFHDYDITSFGVQKAVDELVKNSDQFIDFFFAQDNYQLKSSICGAKKC